MGEAEVPVPDLDIRYKPDFPKGVDLRSETPSETPDPATATCVVLTARRSFLARWTGDGLCYSLLPAGEASGVENAPMETLHRKGFLPPDGSFSLEGDPEVCAAVERDLEGWYATRIRGSSGSGGATFFYGVSGMGGPNRGASGSGGLVR